MSSVSWGTGAVMPCQEGLKQRLLGPRWGLWPVPFLGWGDHSVMTAFTRCQPRGSWFRASCICVPHFQLLENVFLTD